MVNTCTHFCRISHVKLEFFNFCSNFSNFSRFSQMPLDHCISQKNVKIFSLAHCRSLTHIRPTESFTRAYEDNSLPQNSSSLRLRVYESASRESLSEAQRSEARARVYIFPWFFRDLLPKPHCFSIFQFFNFSIFQFSIFQFLNFNFQKGYQSTKSTFSK